MENDKINNLQNLDSTEDKGLDTSAQKGENNLMPKSHLIRKLEKKSKKTLFLTMVGIMALIAIIVLFGQTILIKYSVLVGNTKIDATITPKSLKTVYIAPPVLDRLTEATNSANINISGTITTTADVRIRLYLNDDLWDVVSPDSSGKFKFSEIKLNEGQNKIKSTAVSDGKVSDFSNSLTIQYLKNEPNLTIDYPVDGTNFTSNNNLTIRGKTDGGNSVTVNGFKAITKNDGNFNYNFSMQNGDNTIKIIATDQAGNYVEKEIKVNFTP